LPKTTKEVQTLRRTTYIDREKGKVYNITEHSLEEMLYAIDSADHPFDDVQYLLMDYDEQYPTNGSRITRQYGFRRSLVIETSPDRWFFASFSPTPVKTIFEIMFNNKLMDRSHAASFMRLGFCSLRVSEKANSQGYPKIRSAIENHDGWNFYDYTLEDNLRDVLKRMQNH
jgi:hypothetical protein